MRHPKMGMKALLWSSLLQCCRQVLGIGCIDAHLIDFGPEFPADHHLIT